jgi:hypothetical protein
MPLRKSPARTRFQIALEGESFVLVGKSSVADQFHRQKPFGERYFSIAVASKPVIQIRSAADIYFAIAAPE